MKKLSAVIIIILAMSQSVYLYAGSCGTYRRCGGWNKVDAGREKNNKMTDTKEYRLREYYRERITELEDELAVLKAKLEELEGYAE